MADSPASPTTRASRTTHTSTDTGAPKGAATGVTRLPLLGACGCGSGCGCGCQSGGSCQCGGGC